MKNSVTDTEIPVIHKDNQCLAVNKPAGISIHNPEDPDNLLKVLAARFPSLKLFPVHRLDKETSGVQLFALDATAAARLAGEFQERTVRKVYVGVVRGLLEPASGVWNAPLSDRAESRKNPLGVARDRVAAVTRYRVLEGGSRYFSLVEFDLETGRQHQIRKHSAYARHALVGDARYGDPAYNARMASLYGSGSRMFLHHARLEIAGLVLEAAVPAEFGRVAAGVSG